MQLAIKDAISEDINGIKAIYDHYVLHSTTSLEEIPPSKDTLLERLDTIQQGNLPYLVAKDDTTGEVVGYAYAAPYRARSAYRYTVESSIYIAPDHAGQGIGKHLLKCLIDKCRDKGFKQILAVIAGEDNIASIKLHETLGFKQVGCLYNVGFKQKQWVDTIIMQYNLKK